MTARQVIEAILQPSHRTLKAFNRASFTADPQERARILKRHKIKIRPGESPTAKSNLDVLVPEVGGQEEDDSIGHELVHREQFRRARAKASAAADHYSRKILKSGPVFPDDPDAGGGVNQKAAEHYFGHPYEVMAYAYDAATALKRRYGSDALAHAKAGDWGITGDTRDYTDFLRQYYPPDTPRGRRFLKNLAAYLSQERG